MLPGDESEILSKMRMGTNYRQTISLRKFSCDMRPLTIAETCQIASEVVDDLLKMSKSNQNSMMEHSLMAQKTLVLASTSQPGVKDFKLTEAEVAGMTPDEVHLLYKEYTAAVERVNPAMETLTKEELDLLVAHCKKKPSASELTDLSFYQLVSLAHFLLTKEESPQDK